MGPHIRTEPAKPWDCTLLAPQEAFLGLDSPDAHTCAPRSHPASREDRSIAASISTGRRGLARCPPVSPASLVPARSHQVSQPLPAAPARGCPDWSMPCRFPCHLYPLLCPPPRGSPGQEGPGARRLPGDHAVASGDGHVQAPRGARTEAGPWVPEPGHWAGAARRDSGAFPPLLAQATSGPILQSGRENGGTSQATPRLAVQRRPLPTHTDLE